MDVKERAPLSGVEWASVAGSVSDSDHVHHFGNMIPVDLCGVSLKPIMEKWALFEHRCLSRSLHHVLQFLQVPRERALKALL